METQPAVIEHPAIIPTTEQPAGEKKIYKYQPSYPDGHELAGQPMGGEQVVEYDGTPEDLGAKMAANNNRLQAELRNVKRQAAVSHQTDGEEEIPKDASRLSQFHALQPRRLTPEERIRVAKSLSDPETLEEGADLLFEARYGAKPEAFKRLDDLTTKNYFNQQGQEFRRQHPELPWVTAGGELVKSLLGWCKTRDLAFTVENLELALSRLKKAGLLPEAPIAAEVTPGEIVPGTEERVEADSSIPRAEPSRRPVVRTSALSNRNSSPPVTPVNRGTATWAEIESLSVEQIKAKPEAWRMQARQLFRKQPAEKLNQLSKSKVWIQKMDAC